jgi:hypothetical protein
MENHEKGGFKVLPDGSYSVTIIHEPRGKAGSTTFTFSEIERYRRSEFNAFVEVYIHHEDELKRFSGRLNLSSLSSREGFVRSLGRIVKGKKEFDSYLSEAIAMLSDELNRIPISESVVDIVPTVGSPMLFAPFLTDKSANLIFGDGSSTKTYICIHLALSVASGVPFLGFRPERTGKVLFLDYEDVGTKFADRVNRVAGGMTESPSVEAFERIRYIKAKGVPLSDMTQQLKDEIRKHDISLLVIDSAAYACGSEIERAENVIRFFNALESLQTTSLIIAHITKGQANQDNPERGQKQAIGSIFFHNGPRNTWNVVKQPDDDDTGPEKKVCLYHRKCNDGPLHRLIPVETTFGEGVVTMRVGDEADWEGGKTLSTRILGFLRSGVKSRAQIDEEFDEENRNTVKVALRRLKAAGRITQLGGDKGDYILSGTSLS